MTQVASSPFPLRVDAEVAAWRVSHRLGPYQHLQFERDVAPILQAACEAYRAHPRHETRRLRHLRRHLVCPPSPRLSTEELRLIARDGWEDLRRCDG